MKLLLKKFITVKILSKLEEQQKLSFIYAYIINKTKHPCTIALFLILLSSCLHNSLLEIKEQLPYRLLNVECTYSSELYVSMKHGCALKSISLKSRLEARYRVNKCTNHNIILFRYNSTQKSAIIRVR